MNFREEGTGPLLFFLHGFLGSGDNLMGLSGGLSKRFRCILLDIRNHGASSWTAPFGYEDVADDIFDTAEHLGEESFHLLGHSVGGKAAMTCALMNPEKVLSLVVEDIAPRRYEGQDIRKILNVLASADPGMWKSRRDADEELKSSIPNPEMRSFLLKNLRERNSRFVWRCNLEALSSSFENLSAWPFPEGGGTECYSGPSLFLRAEESDYIQDDDLSGISRYFPNSQVKTVPLATHWAHYDNLPYVLSAIGGFLP